MKRQAKLSLNFQQISSNTHLISSAVEYHQISSNTYFICSSGSSNKDLVHGAKGAAGLVLGYLIDLYMDNSGSEYHREKKRFLAKK